MRRIALAIALVAVPFIGLTPHSAQAANPPDMQCTGAFSGTAHDLTVPANATCLIDSATITHDLIIKNGAGVAVTNTTIGHDVNADHAANIETGFGTGTPGPVTVNHDLHINGSSSSSGPSAPVAFDICDTSVSHDLTVEHANVPYEIEIGDKGSQLYEFCVLAASAPDTVGHDLSIVGNTAGRIDVGDNTINHNLTVQGNTLTPQSPPDPTYTTIDVSDNTVGDTAECSHNNPAVSPASRDGSEDGPNHARRDDGCY